MIHSDTCVKGKFFMAIFNNFFLSRTMLLLVVQDCPQKESVRLCTLSNSCVALQIKMLNQLPFETDRVFNTSWHSKMKLKMTVFFRPCSLGLGKLPFRCIFDLYSSARNLIWCYTVWMGEVGPLAVEMNSNILFWSYLEYDFDSPNRYSYSFRSLNGSFFGVYSVNIYRHLLVR